MTGRFRDTDWCILRTAPSRTLPLVASLSEAGFDVWSPAIKRIMRVGRRRERREVPAAVAPSFVFARFDHLEDLITLSRSPAMLYQVWDAEKRRMVSKGHPYFSVFRYLDAYPWVSDRELDPLRLAEQRGRPRAAIRSVKPGDKVKHPQDGFEGLTGTVQQVKGRYALVCFPGFTIPVHIEPRHLIGELYT